MEALRILVVEDEAIVVMDIEERLAHLGYDPVGHAATGQQALAMVTQLQPDIVLMDIHLQGEMDGITAAQEIRRRMIAPVIFLTAHAEDETLQRARFAEPYGYITKPITDGDLKIAIEIAAYKHGADKKILHLNRLLDLLGQVNQTIIRCQSREGLFDSVCSLAIERGALDLAWIGWVDPETTRIIPVAGSGKGAWEFLQKVEFYTDDRMELQGNPGKAFIAGRSFFCNRCGSLPCLYLSSPILSQYGFHSCGSFPLRFQGVVCGVINLSTREPDFFQERELELMEEVAMDVSFALDKLAADARRKQMEETLQYTNQALLKSVFEREVTLEELRHHQIELSFQNEELRAAQVELDVSRTRYFDLYDLAPVGYCSLSEEGLILEANLSAMLLLGEGRSRLVNQRFSRFILAEDQEIYYWMRKQLLGTGTPQAADLRLAKRVPTSEIGVGRGDACVAPTTAVIAWVHLEASVSRDEFGASVLRVVLSDISQRKQAEEDLRLFKTMIEVSTEAIAVSDKTGRLIYINPAHTILFGRTLAQGQNLGYRDLYPAESIEILDQVVVPSLERGESWEGILNAYDAVGRLFPLWERADAVLGADGQLLFAFGLMHDISEQMRAEEHLRKLEIDKREQAVLARAGEERRILLDNIQTQVWYLSDEHTYGAVNQAHAEFFGLRPEDLAFKDMADSLSGPALASYLQGANEVFATGKAVQSEQWVPNASGEQRCLSVLRSPVLDPDGRIKFVVCSAEDITERKRAEMVLRDSEWRTRLVSEMMTDYIFIADVDSSGVLTLRWASESMLRLTGRMVSEVATPIQWQGILHPDDLPAFSGFIQQVLTGVEVSVIECRTFVKSGREHWIEIFVDPQVDESGKVLSIIGAVKDITERKQTEIEMRRMNQQLEAAVSHAREMAVQAQSANIAKSRFLANMSHEIRTPLNAILGFSQLLQTDPNLSVTQKKRIETINRSGEHLLALLSDILELSKIEAGKQSLNERVFDLRGLLGDLATVFGPRAEARGLHFEAEGIAEVPEYLKADDLKLRQVLTNLLSNAIKFTRRGFVRLRVWVEPGSEGQRLVAVVEDSGPGIAAEEMAGLFGAFEQSSAGRQTGEGTGLGLAISRQFARLMSGDVTVRSVVGQGSVFRLEIAVQVESAAHAGNMVEQRQVLRIEEGSAACKVLVVDDKEDNRILLSEMLSAIGFEVREVAGGMEAVAEFARWQPHLVLMDFRMDGMDGKEAVRQIRRSPGGGAVKIIMQTASATDDSRGEALAAGADDFLAKPFRQNELFEKIRLLVGVRYIYAAVEPAPASVRPPVLTREMLESLPAEFRGQLREGAIRSRHDYLLGLIAQNPGIDPEISALLRDSVARFDYEALF